MTYMRIGTVLLVVGALALIFAFRKAQYFSGESRGVFPIYARDNADVAVQIEVTEADLPVRIVLTATGQRPIMDGQAGRPYASFDIDYGSGVPPENIRLTFASDKAIDTTRTLSHTQSFLLKNEQPGHWRIHLTDTGFRQFKIESATANIKFRSDPPNFILLIFGFIAAGIGFFVVMVAWFAEQRRA